MVPRRTTPNLLPELLHIPPTPHIPNSSLPVLVYRQALATFPYDAILSLLQQNGWKKGGQWKTYKTAHFHSNVHECYVVIHGKCRYLLGCRPEDGAAGGVEMDIEVGDVFVLPAGVSHCAIESEGEFEYVGFYVEVCGAIARREGKG
ncbi:hypothetical protein BS50DRAFT_568165 [Corynespora cassiicola Philippines]|uniref:Cupin type-1 domain-containing protein n=1 Tax=Corynespora cassiicola Philippines TaxID=1448308 RepID=A0A2T2PCZ2_CORCC|nr:hypothetical protein BS50DRAFT_568165 [Corynespora cassiicola Philippines]